MCSIGMNIVKGTMNELKIKKLLTKESVLMSWWDDEDDDEDSADDDDDGYDDGDDDHTDSTWTDESLFRNQYIPVAQW